MGPALLLACYLFVGIVPLGVANGYIERRAKAVRVLPYRYQFVSAVGCWAGLIATPVGLLAAFAPAEWFRGVWPPLGFALLALIGWTAAAVGAWAGVAYLHSQTARHPDYEDAPKPGPPTEPDPADRGHPEGS